MNCSVCKKEVDLPESPPIDESKGEWEVIYCSEKCRLEDKKRIADQVFENFLNLLEFITDSNRLRVFKIIKQCYCIRCGKKLQKKEECLCLNL